MERVRDYHRRSNLTHKHVRQITENRLAVSFTAKYLVNEAIRQTVVKKDSVKSVWGDIKIPKDEIEKITSEGRERGKDVLLPSRESDFSKLNLSLEIEAADFLSVMPQKGRQCPFEQKGRKCPSGRQMPNTEYEDPQPSPTLRVPGFGSPGPEPSHVMLPVKTSAENPEVAESEDEMSSISGGSDMEAAVQEDTEY